MPESLPLDNPSRLSVGKYLLLGELGRGGVGVVYKARDPLLGRDVAVKVLTRAYSAEPRLVERFLREARAVAALNHPHVVTLHEINQEQGAYYLVMELVPCGSALDRLEAQGGLSWREATRITRDACRGLAAAHRAGLIHRDMKPGNILLAVDGTAKIADFGLVRQQQAENDALTMPGCAVGTPLFMSPEQCRLEDVDERTDIYSLGATYYALLTYQPPFRATGHALYVAHCTEPVPDPRRVAPEVPEACAAIVRRAMAKDPASRHASAAEMLAELDAALATPETAAELSGERRAAPEVSVPTVALEGITVATPSPGPVAAATRLAPARRGARRWLVGAAILTLLVPLALLARKWAGPEFTPRWPPSPWRVGGTIECLRISPNPDNSILALGLADGAKGTVVLWDWRAGRVRHEIATDHRLTALALSRSGARVATGEHVNARLAIFDTRTGQKVASYHLGDSGLYHAAFGPDDNTVLAAITVWGEPNRQELRLYDGTSEKAQRTLVVGKKGGISGLAVAPDGTIAVALEDGRIMLVDSTWTPRPLRGAGPDHMYTPSFAPNGRLVAAGSWGTGRALVHVWDTQSGKDVKILGERPGDVTAVAFAPNGKSLASSSTAFIEIWEVSTGKCLGTLPVSDQRPMLRGLVYSPDGTSLFTGGSDSTLTRYDLEPALRP